MESKEDWVQPVLTVLGPTAAEAQGGGGSGRDGNGKFNHKN